MKKKMLLLILLALTFIGSNAQGVYDGSKDDPFEALNKYGGPITTKISDGLKIEINNLKDSIAFYSWAFELKIRKVKDSTIVESISVNDSIASRIVKDYSFLKAINYKDLLGQKKTATLIIPISVILRDLNSPNRLPQKISFYDFSARIRKLFNVVAGKEFNEDYIYLQPLMCYVSKRINDY